MTALLLTSLAVSLGINLTMFIIAYVRQSDKLTDISYAVTFATIALYGFYKSDGSPSHILLASAVGIWSLRLGSFLLYRVIKRGKDSRFDGTRENFVKFGKFWLGQALTVWVLMIPSILAFGATLTLTIGSLIGLVVWASGLIIETTADIQKMNFANNPANKNKWIESGIWRYSRHPNYYGEILVWVGLYLYVIPGLSITQTIFGLISPIAITCLLLFVSGIPVLEKAADKRWGNLAAYQEYKRRTSLLILLPRKST